MVRFRNVMTFRWMLVLSLVVLAHTLAPVTLPARGAGGAYDGRALFEGIMYGRGPVAELLPEIRDNLLLKDTFPESTHPEAIHATYKALDHLVAAIDRTDPTFFDRFERGITSGDHVLIEATLREASKRMLNAVLEVPEFRVAVEELDRDAGARDLLLEAAGVPKEQMPKVEELIHQIASGQGDAAADMLCLAAYNVFAVLLATITYVVVAVHIVTVINAGLALSIDLYIATLSDYGASRGSSLMEDQLVNSIALRLAA